MENVTDWKTREVNHLKWNWFSRKHPEGFILVIHLRLKEKSALDE